jgi:hypothetical protein
MAHVDAEDVRAGGEQCRDGLSVGRSRPESRDDFDAAAAGLHWRSPIIAALTAKVRFGRGSRSVELADLRICLVGQLHRPALRILAGVDFEEPGSVVTAYKAILSAVDLELSI